DITHGAAGIGLTLLHFFHKTGNPQFLQGALALAESLSSGFSAESETGALTWSRNRLTSPVVNPEEVFYGFAHGIAGVAYFYLCMFLTLKREEFLSVSCRSASTLLKAARSQGNFLYWPHGPARSTLWPHWCNGNSGVGTFLIRFAAATGDRAACRLAVRGARAIFRERWISGLGQCHGLAGNGEYLLDLFHFTGEQQFQQAALYLAGLIDLHRIYRPAGITFPDDTGFPTGIDFSIGPAGIASFLSRLASGSPRLLMLDYLFSCTTPSLSPWVRIWS
ncbi:MAG TPA: lanthionine synthetase LanC family protein, partial [Thermoanaerobaculia bacterium]|nr:lanthionine synthetase LanC family protein [Thermoanaerobaculia bacterium]